MDQNNKQSKEGASGAPKTHKQQTIEQSITQVGSLKERVSMQQNIDLVFDNSEVNATAQVIQKFKTSIEAVNKKFDQRHQVHSIELSPTNDTINYRVNFETQQGIKTYQIESFHDTSKINTSIFTTDSLPELQEALKKIDEELQLRQKVEDTYGIKIVLADKFQQRNQRLHLPKNQLFSLENNTHFDSRLKSLQLVVDKLKFLPPKKLPIEAQHVYIMKDNKGNTMSFAGIYTPKPLNNTPRTFFTPEVFLHEFFHQWDFEVDKNPGWFNLLPSKTDKYWQKTLKTKYDFGLGSMFFAKNKKKELSNKKDVLDYHNDNYRNVSWLEETAKYSEMLWNDLTFKDFENGNIEDSQTDWLFTEAAGQPNKDGTFTIDKKALRSQLAIEMMTGQYFTDMYKWFTDQAYIPNNPEIKKDVIADMKEKKIVPYLRVFDDRMSTKKYWQTYFRDRKLTDKFWENAPTEPFLDKQVL
jgi:hypothetical protein